MEWVFGSGARQGSSSGRKDRYSWEICVFSQWITFSPIPPPPQITLGRSTKDAAVDIDLSLEGPAWKVSRKQGIIKLRNSGEFFIANAGKRPIFVDGKPVLTGNKYKLNDNSVVEVSETELGRECGGIVVSIIRPGEVEWKRF